jgi:hypothetical protein
MYVHAMNNKSEPDKPWPMRAQDERNELEHLRAENQTVWNKLELAEERNRRAAAFLDGLADIFERDDWPNKAADCRALARKLRGET